MRERYGNYNNGSKWVPSRSQPHPKCLAYVPEERKKERRRGEKQQHQQQELRNFEVQNFACERF
jgi:hypothetical protein